MLGIFLDIETSGLNTKKHRILEIAIKILDLETLNIEKSYSSIIKQSPDIWKRSDPFSLKINGFTWDLVSTGKDEEQAAEEISALFLKKRILRENALYICQNPSFDRAFFSQLIDVDIQEKHLWPYHWLDLASMYWSRRLQSYQDKMTSAPWETGVSKDSIASQYHLPKENQPHRAMNGVDHLILCYKAVNSNNSFHRV